VLHGQQHKLSQRRKIEVAEQAACRAPAGARGGEHRAGEASPTVTWRELWELTGAGFGRAPAGLQPRDTRPWRFRSTTRPTCEHCGGGWLWACPRSCPPHGRSQISASHAAPALAGVRRWRVVIGGSEASCDSSGPWDTTASSKRRVKEGAEAPISPMMAPQWKCRMPHRPSCATPRQGSSFNWLAPRLAAKSTDDSRRSARRATCPCQRTTVATARRALCPDAKSGLRRAWAGAWVRAGHRFCNVGKHATVSALGQRAPPQLQCVRMLWPYAGWPWSLAVC
jgi:hypothetical protein